MEKPVYVVDEGDDEKTVFDLEEEAKRQRRAKMIRNGLIGVAIGTVVALAVSALTSEPTDDDEDEDSSDESE